MNDMYIVTTFVVIDDLLTVLGHSDDIRSQVSGSEVLTVAVVAAKYFQNHHERALCVLQRLGDIRPLSVSRFNRRLHALGHWLDELMVVLSDLLGAGSLVLVDSMPVPVCKNVRARRCRKVQGRTFWGYCAMKDEYFYGWKLHLCCTVAGRPVTFAVLPASCHDLVPLHDLTAPLPPGTTLLADKAYNSVQDEQLAYGWGGVRLVPRRRENMSPNSADDMRLLKAFRSVVETVYSQLEKMGVQRLHARSNSGFFAKLNASLLALLFNSLV